MIELYEAVWDIVFLLLNYLKPIGGDMRFDWVLWSYHFVKFEQSASIGSNDLIANGYDQHQIYLYGLVLMLWSYVLEELVSSLLAPLNEGWHNYPNRVIMMSNHHEHFVASLSGAKPGFHELMMIGDLSSFLRWLDVVTVTTDA